MVNCILLFKPTLSSSLILLEIPQMFCSRKNEQAATILAFTGLPKFQDAQH